MKTARNDSGQVMLTCAFLFAIILVIITVMLNNVIYSNNIAYLGFMGQAGYDERSIKQTTLDEAAYAYEQTGGNTIKYEQYMSDYADAMNTLTLSRGLYVTVDSTPQKLIPVGQGFDETYPATVTSLNIFEKDSKWSYKIKTNYQYLAAGPVSTPAPTPVPVPNDATLLISANTTTIVADGNDYALVYILAKNKSSKLGIQVNLHAANGEFQNLTTGAPTTSVVTDSATGLATVKYLSLVPGSQVMNATAGTAKSGNLLILCNPMVLPGTCSHTVTVGSPTRTYSNDKVGSKWLDFVTVTVPITIPAGNYDFSDFKVEVFNESSSNLELMSPNSDIDDYQEKHDVEGPGAYDHREVSAKLHWINKTKPYSGVLKVRITAICNIDNVAYNVTTTVPYNGA